VLLINGMERDKMFFLITGVTLTGQQSGTVGLRLRLTTYLRSPVGTENTAKTLSSGDGDVAAGGDSEKQASSGSASVSTKSAGGRR
jgi:type IV pilus assembly protein PilO